MGIIFGEINMIIGREVNFLSQKIKPIKIFGFKTSLSAERIIYLAIAGLGFVGGATALTTRAANAAPLFLVSGGVAGLRLMKNAEVLPTEFEAKIQSQEQKLIFVEHEYEVKFKELEEKEQFLLAQYQKQTETLELEYQQKLSALVAREELLYTEIKQSVNEEQAHIDAQLKTAKASLEAELIAVIEEYQASLNQIQEQHCYEIELKDNAIYQLQAQLQQATACKLPPKSAKRIHHAALQVQEILLEHEVAVDWVDSWAQPKSQFDTHWFSVKYGIPKYKVLRAIENIPGKVEGYYTAQPTWEDGKVQIDCSLFDPSAQKTRKVKGIEIEEAPDNWLSEALCQIFNEEHGGYHVFINGPTGTGKGTLVSNLLAFAHQKMGRLDLRLIDPKYPDTEWMIDGRKFTPQYRGFTPWTNPDGITEPCAMDGLLEMEDSVLARLEEAREAEYLELEKPRRETILWVVDEAERLIAENPKNTKNKGPNAVDSIQQTLKVGRSTKNILIMLGQSPMCSRYGMLETDLDNFGIAIWLGAENIKKGIDETCTYLATRKRLLKQLEAWEMLAGEDPSNIYIALVKTRGILPFIAKLPPPNSFGTLASELEFFEGEDSPESPVSKGAPMFMVSVPSFQSTEKLADDARRLDHVNELRKNNPQIGIEQIIATVYYDWNVLTKEGNKSARKWRKAREHLRSIAQI